MLPREARFRHRRNPVNAMGIVYTRQFKRRAGNPMMRRRMLFKVKIIACGEEEVVGFVPANTKIGSGNCWSFIVAAQLIPLEKF